MRIKVTTTKLVCDYCKKEIFEELHPSYRITARDSLFSADIDKDCCSVYCSWAVIEEDLDKNVGLSNMTIKRFKTKENDK